jgi:PQQ-like domain
MAGHDAARTSRSSIVSAQAPALLPGWPVSDEGWGSPLVAPDGTLVRQGSRFTATMNRNGTLRRVLVAAGVDAIGVDGRLFGFSGVGRLAAYTSAGRLLWRTSRLDAAPEASDRAFTVAQDGNVYWMASQDTPVALDADGRRIWDSDGDCCLRLPVLAVGPTGTIYYSPPSFAPSGLVARRPDGTTLWERALPGRATSVAVADDGTVLVLTDSGGLHAFSSDGNPRWSAGIPLGASRMAIGADGSVSVVASGVVLAVGADGTVRWTYRGAVTLTDPIIGGDGTVYVGGSPLVALRPDGSRAWWAKGVSQPLVPKAIGADGTLYAETSVLEGTFATPGGTLLALAGPAASVRVTIPVPERQRVLISGLRVIPRRFRMRGPESLCAPTGGCRPTDPLGATLSFTLKRDAVVSWVVRHAGSRNLVARSTRRVRAGTMWRSFSDVTNHRPMPPGRYAVTATAKRGNARVTVGPVLVSIVR